jgi:hypothetical protein
VERRVEVQDVGGEVDTKSVGGGQADVLGDVHLHDLGDLQ